MAEFKDGIRCHGVPGVGVPQGNGGGGFLKFLIISAVCIGVFYLIGSADKKSYRDNNTTQKGFDLGVDAKEMKRLDEMQNDIYEAPKKQDWNTCRDISHKSREQCLDELSRQYDIDFRKFSWAY